MSVVALRQFTGTPSLDPKTKFGGRFGHLALRGSERLWLNTVGDSPL
jgi:hypothetical protein